MLKRFISILLTVVMVSTFGVGMNFGQNVEVKAATAGITNGATYTIVSAYNGRINTDRPFNILCKLCGLEHRCNERFGKMDIKGNRGLL